MVQLSQFSSELHQDCQPENEKISINYKRLKENENVCVFDMISNVTQFQIIELCSAKDKMYLPKNHSYEILAFCILFISL